MRRPSNEYHVEGLAQDCSNFIANAMKLLQSCTKASKCNYVDDKVPMQIQLRFSYVVVECAYLDVIIGIDYVLLQAVISPILYYCHLEHK